MTSIPLDRHEGYRRDIDGIRALAILPVVLYHAGVPCLRGGFIGVDVFFVVSGFLITGIVLRDLRAGRFSLAQFYVRRARRILPALFVVLLATLLLGVLVLLPDEVRNLGKMTAATALFFSNFMLWRDSGYFDVGAELKPLMMTWSLGIEEQFYLLWPAAILVFLRRRFSHLWLMAILGAASFAMAWLGVYLAPAATFFLIPGRAWELLLGAALATGQIRPQSSWPRVQVAANLAAWAGLLLVIGAATLLDGDSLFPGPGAIAPCLGAALLIWAGPTSWVNRNILGSRPAVAIGVISYSLYLWHWPLLSMLRLASNGDLEVAAAGAAVMASLALAWLTWRFVEQPFRHGSVGSPFATLARYGVGTAVVCLIGAVAFVTRGLPHRNGSAEVQAQAARSDVNPLRQYCHRDPSSEAPWDNRCFVNGPTGRLVVLWGDSHADALAPGVRAWAERQGLGFVQFTASTCPPLPGVGTAGRRISPGCAQFNERVLAYIAGEPRIELVVAAARWAYYAETGPFGRELASSVFLVADSSTAWTRENSRRCLLMGLEALVGRVAAVKKPLALVGPVPEMGTNVPDCMLRREVFGRPRRSGDQEQRCSAPVELVRARLAYATKALMELSERHKGVQVFFPFNSLCGSGSCAIFADDVMLYSDDNHLAGAGSRYLARSYRFGSHGE